MSHAIDLNRGVMIKKHPSGMLVYMYMDTPGVYLNAFGVEIPEVTAKAADFDIVLLGKQKLRRERMREAMTEIEMELELVNSAAEEKVLWARGGYRVVALGLGNAHVFDEEDHKMTSVPIPEAEAKLLLDHLAPADKEAEQKDED